MTETPTQNWKAKLQVFSSLPGSLAVHGLEDDNDDSDNGGEDDISIPSCIVLSSVSTIIGCTRARCVVAEKKERRQMVHAYVAAMRLMDAANVEVDEHPKSEDNGAACRKRSNAALGE
ncbi:uncharacterized protein IUM83_08171 [Phytophthora cinnamomi]|uniref:uncharacterized protein n=1 Tax=Phytophthora cinnamomi TaxID=4785 RepID=UPI00355A1C90|nr:hypothetical protein IUM83_08171 [Phytophthora cinnamomi]